VITLDPDDNASRQVTIDESVDEGRPTLGQRICDVFTSRDNFHKQIVPLFLDPSQTFVNGDDLKNDLQRLDALYSALPEERRKEGLINFAAHPPEDASFLTTQLWDKHLPGWREIAAAPKRERDPEEDKRLIDEINQMSDSPDLQAP
jgi:hypothetical protein